MEEGREGDIHVRQDAAAVATSHWTYSADAPLGDGGVKDGDADTFDLKEHLQEIVRRYATTRQRSLSNFA